MSHTGEFELIGRISAQFNDDKAFHLPPGVAGIGDDCAVLPQHDGLDTLVTTDLLIEDRHFLLSDISPYELGWKSAAVNISDIAAMGGRPTASFLSIALPGDMDVQPWVERFITGFRELSARFGVPLLGGDTSASPDKLFINVTVLGECPHGRAVMRSGALPGDLVCVTGPLGDAAAGLKLILERHAAGLSSMVQTEVPLAANKAQNAAGGTSPGTIGGASNPSEVLISRHYLPMPRVEEGMALRDCPGVHAMMDISDGIASDLRHILEGSSVLPSSDPASFEDGVPKNYRLSSNQASFEDGTTFLGAEIDLAALPLSPELRTVCAGRGWDACELAVSGGEDYELLVTMAPEALEAARAALGERIFVIGRIVESGAGEGRNVPLDGPPGPSIRWLGGSKDYKGFTHF